jgi:hypothetical protein
MSLDVGVGDGSSLGRISGEPSFSLEDGALYWFLHPLFVTLATRTGQYVDLYGDASFSGEQLSALEEMLTVAKELAEAQPESWEVHVGTQVAPVQKELFQRLDREALPGSARGMEARHEKGGAAWASGGLLRRLSGAAGGVIPAVQPPESVFGSQNSRRQKGRTLRSI